MKQLETRMKMLIVVLTRNARWLGNVFKRFPFNSIEKVFGHDLRWKFVLLQHGASHYIYGHEVKYVFWKAITLSPIEWLQRDEMNAATLVLYVLNMNLACLAVSMAITYFHFFWH